MSAAPVPRERDILAACLRLLRLAGIPAFRANTGAVRLASRSGRARFVRFGPKGQSDILGIIPKARDGRRGVFLAVETKRPGEKPTPEQQAFLDAVTAAGGLALVVSDVTQLEAALRREGALS